MSGTVPSLAANIEKPPGTPIDPADAERVKLFQPFKQKSVTLHNRLGVSPMCMYSSTDGHLNDFHILHCKLTEFLPPPQLIAPLIDCA